MAHQESIPQRNFRTHSATENNATTLARETGSNFIGECLKISCSRFCNCPVSQKWTLRPDLMRPKDTRSTALSYGSTYQNVFLGEWTQRPDFSDLFKPASSHWLPRQQQARAQGFTLFVSVHNENIFLTVPTSYL
mgnify:CR=1 FL=1